MLMQLPLPPLLRLQMQRPSVLLPPPSPQSERVQRCRRRTTSQLPTLPSIPGSGRDHLCALQPMRKLDSLFGLHHWMRTDSG